MPSERFFRRHLCIFRFGFSGVSTAFGLVGADLGGEFVEDAVDEFVPVRTAEGFGYFDGFVDDDGVGCFGHGGQLVAGGQQDGAFDGVEVFFVPVEQRADLSDVLCRIGLRAEEKFVEQFFVCLGKVGHFADVFSNLGCCGAVDKGLVNGLYGKLAGTTAGCFQDFSLKRLGGTVCRLKRKGRIGVRPVCYSSSSNCSSSRRLTRLAHSTATLAASEAFSSIRSIACASFSVVRTALAIGML